MYKSPITQITNYVNERFDNNIVTICHEVGIHVDRDELLRALRYDRDQYNKGFDDGAKSVTPEWISVEERLPKEYGQYLCYNQSPYGAGITICGYALDLTKIDDYDFLEKKSGWYKYDSEYGYYETDDITHWMPLPKPPKGGDNNG